MAVTKINSKLAAKIRAARARGETITAIAKRYGLSTGRISTFLREPEAPSRSPRAAAPPPAPVAPPSPDDLRRDLAGQIASLRNELEAAETPPLRATLNRLLVSAQQLLAKITPPDPATATPGMVLVPVAEIDATAATGESRLQALIRDTAQWPRCEKCGGVVSPYDSRAASFVETLIRGIEVAKTEFG